MPFRLLFGCALLSAPALADPLQVTSAMMTEHRQPAPDGTTRITLAPAARLSPGDRVVVVVRYRNAGQQPIANLTLADPLPASLIYVGPHAGSAEPEVSADGRRFAALGALTVPAAGGGTRPALRLDVHAVQWRVATLAPGASAQFALDAIVR